MENLLLLHGAIGSKAQLQPLAQELKSKFQVFEIDFSGHGGEPIPTEPFSMTLFANDVITWMDKKGFKQINIFGYSMGGYVALYLAKNFPNKINRIFTLATKFDWTEEIAQKEIKQLNPEKIKEKIPAFAEILKQRHEHTSWELVLKKTSEMMISLGKKNSLKLEDFSSMNHFVLLSIGDKDSMVTIEETLAVYRRLANAALLVIPYTPHPIEKVNIGRLTNEISLFFKEDKN